MLLDIYKVDVRNKVRYPTPPSLGYIMERDLISFYFSYVLCRIKAVDQGKQSISNTTNRLSAKLLEKTFPIGKCDITQVL